MLDYDLIQLRNAVRRYALKNYYSDGWDILADHYDDGDIYELISDADAQTPEQAIQACLASVKRRNAERVALTSHRLSRSPFI